MVAASGVAAASCVEGAIDTAADIWPAAEDCVAASCVVGAIGTDAESRLADAERESGEDSTAEGATKLDGGIATEPSSVPPANPRPQAWQLVCPRNMSFAPQNWHVWPAGPWPNVTLDLSIRPRTIFPSALCPPV